MNVFPKWLLYLVLFSILCLVLWYFSNIVICILLAGVLSLINKPVFDLLKKVNIGKFKLPLALCAILTIIFFLLFFGIGFALLIPLIVNQVNAISSIDLEKILVDLKTPIDNLDTFLHQYNIIESDKQSLVEFIKEQINELLQLASITAILQMAFKTTGNFFFYFFSSLFMLFFFLKDELLFQKIISVFVPDNQEEKLADTLNNVRNMLFRYFVAIIVQISLITTYVALLLYFFDVKNALLIGLLAGLLNIIPYLGPSIGLMVAIILGCVAQIQIGEYEHLNVLIIKIIGVFATMQLLDNNLLAPFIFSKSTNSHPLEIFIVIIAAGTIGGIGAMIAAVPAYTIVRIIITEFFSENPMVKRVLAKF